jgi:hypothetical protein
MESGYSMAAAAINAVPERKARMDMRLYFFKLRDAYAAYICDLVRGLPDLYDSWYDAYTIQFKYEFLWHWRTNELAACRTHQSLSLGPGIGSGISPGTWNPKFNVMRGRAILRGPGSGRLITSSLATSLGTEAASLSVTADAMPPKARRRGE